MKKTKKGTKQFTKKEKLQILGEAKKNGLKLTLEKYDLYAATYYYWKKKYAAEGEAGLDHKVTKATQALVRQLKKENQALKILLAEKELESKLKDELLKKKYPNLRR